MKEQLLAHFEKGVLGVSVVLLIAFVYSAFSHETYKRTPDQFTTVTQAARKNVTSTKPNTEKLVTPDFQKAVTALKTPIDSQPYAYRFEWRRPFDYGLSFRKQPRILTPGKPVCQSNRGLFSVFKTDLATGKLAVRKVKKSKSQGPDGKQSRLAAVSTGWSFNDINQGIDSLSGHEKDVNVREFIFDNPQVGELIGALNVPAPDVRVTEKKAQDVRVAPTGENRGFRRRTVLPGDEAAAKKKDETATKKEEDVEIEEYIPAMEGKHFVEVVATFPHAEQIKEYVKALREPANQVGLFYALTDVERREYLEDHTWSEWKPIDFKEQAEVILKSAYGMEPEPFPAVVMKGLSMNIPYLLSQYKPFLTLEEFKNPKIHEYAPEEMEPARFLHVKKDAKKEKKSSKKTKAEPATPTMTRQAAGVNLAVPDSATAPAGAIDNKFQTETAMIRFWDFTVVPGKRYQYRVRVKVYNPNFHRPDVAAPEFAAEKYLESAWSEPSDGVFVEPDVQWFAKGRDRERSDRASIEAHYWYRDAGEWIVSEFKQKVGEMIGLSSSPKSFTIRLWDEDQMTMKVEERGADSRFDARAVLLDVTGGRERIGSGRFVNVPVEMVAVNAYGDLVRRVAEEDNADHDRTSIAAAYEDLVKELRGTTKRVEAAADEDGSSGKLKKKLRIGGKRNQGD